jgi:hypothetical protein
MNSDVVAPCRHADPPPDAVVDRVIELINSLNGEERLLDRHGLSSEEYRRALEPAIQKWRGRISATTAERDRFVMDLFEAMAETGRIEKVERPKHGRESVFRLAVPGVGPVAVIRKGCPDGDHNKNWTVPDWARETYMWWVCPSTSNHPGWHIEKGVKRLRAKFLDEGAALDGIIYSGPLCGTAERLCPKSANAVEVSGKLMPPPCVYVMPDRESGVQEWNWKGRTSRRFPAVLLGFFGIDAADADMFTGSVGFQKTGPKTARSVITSRAGLGLSDTFRS